MARLFCFLCVISLFQTASAVPEGFSTQDDDSDYPDYSGFAPTVLVTPCADECHCTSSGSNSAVTVSCTDGSTTQIPIVILVHPSLLVIIMNSNIKILGERFIPDRQRMKDVKLAYLDLRNNGITEIRRNAFVGLLHLRVLVLSNNFISKIHKYTFDGLPNLTSVDLSHNNISDIPEKVFAKLPKLMYLRLSLNKVRAIGRNAFAGMPHLAELDLSHNNISDIPEMVFAKLPMLMYLRLSLNKVRAIGRNAFAGMPHLAELHLDGNVITSIHKDAFSFLSSLQILDLSLNLLRVLNGSLFLGMFNLRRLTVSHNSELSNFPNLDGLASITTLGASDTSIEEIPEELCHWTPNIILLELTWCALEEIPDFSDCLNLEYLYLGSNKLTSGSGLSSSLNGLSNLLELSLRSNCLTKITQNTFSGLHHLQHLDLSYNKISEISDGAFNGVKSLKQLFLQGNNLSEVHNQTFHGLTFLQFLNLRDNRISMIANEAFHNFSHLESLYLDNNELTAIADDLFSGMGRLLILCLGHNKLSTFGQHMLKASIYLNKIILGSNQLEWIPEETFSYAWETLRVIDLSHNNLEVKERFTNALIDRLSLLTVLDLSHNNFNGSYYVTIEYRRNFTEADGLCHDIRTNVSITEKLGASDGSPLCDARLSELYSPCTALDDGFVGSGDGFLGFDVR